MKKIAILISLIFVCSFSFSQRIQRILPGDDLPTALSKVNKVIDDNIVKNASVIYVIDFGVVADGVTDDSRAIQAAIDFAPEDSYVSFPAGKNIKISLGVYTEKKLKFIGNHVNIICDSNVPAFYLNVQDQCIFTDFVFTGSGRNVPTKTDQSGLMFNGGVRHLISNLTFNSMSGVGLLGVNNYGESSTLQQQGSSISNIILWNNKIGIALMSRSEYNEMTNVIAYENDTGIQDYSGNNSLTGFTFETNVSYGYRMAAGNNVGHGTITSGAFNHHTAGFGIHCNANGTGVLITAVNFYQTNNRFENGTKNVVFSGCAFDGTAAAGAVTFDGSTTFHNVIQDCFFTVAGVDPKTKFSATNSAKFSVVNMRRTDGAVYNFGNLATTLLAAKTTNYTVTSGDTEWIVKFDCTSGPLTASILSAVGMDGQRIIFQKVDASANAMILDPNGSETINGSSTSLSITKQWQTITLESNGANWLRIDDYPDFATSGSSTFNAVGSYSSSLITINSNTTLNSTHKDVIGSESGGTTTITLPLASSCEGREYFLKKGSGGGGTVVLQISGSDNIDGLTSRILVSQFDYIKVKSSGGTTWYIQDVSITASASLDFGSTPIPAAGEEVLTISFPGAADGDQVSLGVPNSATGTNIQYPLAWVSSSNTVSIKCFNGGLVGDINPGSGVFKINVKK